MIILLAPFVGPYIAYRLMWAFYDHIVEVNKMVSWDHIAHARKMINPAQILQFPKRGGV